MRRIRKCLRPGCLAYEREGSQPPELLPIFSFRGFHLVNRAANGDILRCRLGDEIEIEQWTGSLCYWDCDSRGYPHLELIGLGSDRVDVVDAGEGRYSTVKFRAVQKGATQVQLVHVDGILRHVAGALKEVNQFHLQVKVT
jgi:hypothetical protein